MAPRVPQPSWLADAATVIALVLVQRLCFHVGGDFCIGRQSIACSARTYWRPVCSHQNFSPVLAGKHGLVDLVPWQEPAIVMLGAGLSCCKASCHAAGYEAQVQPFRTISEKCGVRSEDCLDGPRSFFPRFVSLNWGLGRPGQAPGVAGAASSPARATLCLTAEI